MTPQMKALSVASKTKKIPLVYIAGPVRAETAWEIEQNIRIAETGMLNALMLGCAPLCPHSMFRFFGDGHMRERLLLAALEQMVRCDAVFVVGNWQLSEGTCHELKIAAERGIPVFYQLHKLADWKDSL